MRTHRCDVLIVGAGPAGAHLASLLGRAGFSVILVDKNLEGETGARWVNGIPLWVFAEAGLEKPEIHEVHTAGSRFTLIDPTHQARVSISVPFLLDVDMRSFGDRLVSRAQASPGVRVMLGKAIKGFEFDHHGRPLRAFSQTDSFEAELMVDVSGLSAIIRKGTPFLKELCPPIEPKDLCRAAQEVRAIKDPHGALNFLEKQNCQSGEILSWVGVAGGYSVLRIQIASDLRTMAFLTGSRALFGVPSGAKIIQNFIATHPWVGDKIFGGQRAIPLGRPYAHLVAPGVALVGDSAGQVYASHGSGIAMGLLAAKILAKHLIQGATRGDDIGSLSVLWGYAHEFHDTYGPLLAMSDLNRRFSQTLSPYEVHQIIASGLLSAGILRSSLMQQRPEISWRETSNQMKALVRAPGLSMRVMWAFSKLPKILWASKQYPSEPDLPKALAYERRLAGLL
ncbi:MAG: NAD(P)/FAD-dependent oxidoreductase [Myxococcota bacterium]